MESRRRLLALPPALLAAAPCARAQSSWPERAVRVIVPFPGGSTPDLAARVLLPHFQEVFGQPFVVENRAGAGGNIGTDLIAKATDGHTIGVSINGPLATAPFLFPNLPYDPARDIAPIALLARTAQVLVVHPSLPARDLAGFIAHLRAEPGRLSYGSVGAGSGGHLAMVELLHLTGTSAEHIPYRGFPQAVVDLVAGRIQAMVLVLAGILPQIREGQVRALAVTSEQRLPQLPEVPTLIEAGFPDAVSHAWVGLIGPASMPAERIRRLSEETRRALAAPAVRERLEAAGFSIHYLGPEQFRAHIAAEAARWGALIRRFDIRADQ
ncbi:MAG: tripartite tricarboxylate transporter substrate binding protein [Rhodovarius sp.]|nr:tripartite tricarboxylate transporter substrate binding protein [Rhodovarius sp.]MDW8314709.1 tripartite tricarboxylate transporter substrate binding protein [Rhodovarius sp.]